VGERIPSFRLTDQHGREQTLETLRGPNGLVLASVRSADW
jgi:peroxiredoxin